MMKIKKILLLLVLTGCTLTSNIPTVTKTNKPELTQTNAISVTSLPTFTPTITNLPAQSPTNTLQQTWTPIPTWTPLPTLEPTTAVLFVEELLQNNDGCQLPCWWGITPGKTTWIEAKHFLDSFSNFMGVIGNPNDLQIAEFNIPAPEEIGSIEQLFEIRGSIVEAITHIYFGNLTTSYNLVNLLKTYGTPSDILISAYYEPRYTNYMVVVAVFYLQTGILVEYNDNGGGLVGDKIEVCPQEATYPHLDLWAPSLNLSLNEASDRYLDTRNWPAYRNIQEATGMNVESFYSTFKEPNNESCLELSTTDWPKY